MKLKWEFEIINYFPLSDCGRRFRKKRFNLEEKWKKAEKSYPN